MSEDAIHSDEPIENGKTRDDNTTNNATPLVDCHQQKSMRPAFFEGRFNQIIKAYFETRQEHNNGPSVAKFVEAIVTINHCYHGPRKLKRRLV